jgi:hypothetical protein
MGGLSHVLATLDRRIASGEHLKCKSFLFNSKTSAARGAERLISLIVVLRTHVNGPPLKVGRFFIELLFA